MAEHGIRAEEGGYGRRTILKNKDNYNAWCQKLSLMNTTASKLCKRETSVRLKSLLFRMLLVT